MNFSRGCLDDAASHRPPLPISAMGGVDISRVCRTFVHWLFYALLYVVAILPQTRNWVGVLFVGITPVSGPLHLTLPEPEPDSISPRCASATGEKGRAGQHPSNSCGTAPYRSPLRKYICGTTKAKPRRQDFAPPPSKTRKGGRGSVLCHNHSSLLLSTGYQP